jgi:primosomal protein N' (replication factor Y)
MIQLDVLLPLPLNHLYTYGLPEEIEIPRTGVRVVVPFGSKKWQTGIVWRIREVNHADDSLKEIVYVLDETPWITEQQMLFFDWLSTYYMSPLGLVLKAAIPSALLLSSQTLVQLTPEAHVDADQLTDQAYMMLEALAQHKSLPLNTLLSIGTKSSGMDTINDLVDQGFILVEQDIKEKYVPKYETFIRADIHQKSLSSALPPKQKALFSWCLEKSTGVAFSIKKKELTNTDFWSPSAYRSLVDKELLLEKSVRVDRIVWDQNESTKPLKPLYPPQNVALNELLDRLYESKVTLLHGITGSGKTEVYAHLFEELLQKDRQVLFLLPEIALTTQLIKRMQMYFGDKVATYHSGMSQNERVEVWRRVAAGTSTAQLILGTRSAVFLPWKSLGLVVVDEEHESAYRQTEPAPRYQGRDAAIYAAHLYGCGVVLGSATPSLTSMAHAQSGKYGYVRLDERHLGTPLPQVLLIDLKEQQLKKKMKGHFSSVLIDGISECLGQGKQVILFQNRRGFSPSVQCTSCGHSPQCPSCDVSLTYHKQGNILKCHYCGFFQNHLSQCPSCRAPGMETLGLGTQQVLESFQELFPGVSLKRMDQDTTRRKNAYQELIDGFEQQSFKVLIGTQMLSKGLDFKQVGLVGVLQADAMLHHPEYYAHEQAFQILYQLGGRSGRSEAQGKFYIQTYMPEHPLLQQVSRHDYAGMVETQLAQRRTFQYPPEVKLIKVILKHKSWNTVDKGAHWLAHQIVSRSSLPVLGPADPAVARIKDQFIKHIVVKVPPHVSLSGVKKSLSRLQQTFEAIPEFRSIRLLFQVDY